ncbi:Ribosomal protein L7/L12 [Abeliophyllum distichum]|uniref:Ribosomal protein L7/L12 n=1 Tax=Abeliophyllum distichum TaxID=126358 RepID=A0ABD1QER8_9LAMI
MVLAGADLASYYDLVMPVSMSLKSPTKRVWRLVDEILELTLVVAIELSSIIMKKLGMKELLVMKPGAVGVATVSMNASMTAKEEKKLEKTTFELKIESFDSTSKLKLIE